MSGNTYIDHYEGDIDSDGPVGRDVKRIQRRIKRKDWPIKCLNTDKKKEWMSRVKFTYRFLKSLNSPTMWVPPHIFKWAQRNIQFMPQQDQPALLERYVVFEGQRLMRLLCREKEILIHAHNTFLACKQDKPNLKEAIKSMLRIMEVEITALMLKKNPQVVFLFARLLIFGKRIPESITSIIEQNDYAKMCKMVRLCARYLFDSFKEVFDIPLSIPFLPFYRSQVGTFERASKSIPGPLVGMVVDDPSGFLSSSDNSDDNSGEGSSENEDESDMDTGSESEEEMDVDLESLTIVDSDESLPSFEELDIEMLDAD